MPEITIEVIVGSVLGLAGLFGLFKDKLPSKETVLSYFKFKKKENGECVKISNLNKLWAIREDFEPQSPVYENLTQAIENLIRQEKEEKEVVVNE